MIWLEANTERSESNPGRSLGIIDVKRMAVWKTVPPTERSIRVNPINPRSKKHREVKRTRIERIQRILSGGDTRSTSEASASIRILC